ncbi:MAG: hypothetical protein QF752_08105 [Planctomycetota bacterium]|jgi:hypothetical protein|nr:hypothetical protein [Planctomycetota bacterium]
MTRFLVFVLLMIFCATPVSATENERASEWKLAIEKKLQQDASVDFEDMPLLDCVEFLSKMYEIPILLDPMYREEEGGLGVSLKLKGIRLKDVLSILCSLKGVVLKIACGSVVLARVERAASLPRTVPSFGSGAGKGLQKKLATLRSNLEFKDCPLKVVVKSYNEILDSSIVVSPRLGKKKVTFFLKDFRVDQGLALLAWGVEGRVEYRHSVIQVIPVQ